MKRFFMMLLATVFISAGLTAGAFAKDHEGDRDDDDNWGQYGTQYVTRSVPVYNAYGQVVGYRNVQEPVQVREQNQHVPKGKAYGYWRHHRQQQAQVNQPIQYQPYPNQPYPNYPSYPSYPTNPPTTNPYPNYPTYPTYPTTPSNPHGTVTPPASSYPYPGGAGGSPVRK